MNPAIVYIPSLSAEPLSEALWRLTDPDPTRGTLSLFGTAQALDKSKWLKIDTSAEIPVHPYAVLNGIADVLQPYIDRGEIPSGTNELLAALVESKRGQTLVVYEAFPPFFKSQALTHEQMVEQGKFAPTPTPTP